MFCRIDSLYNLFTGKKNAGFIFQSESFELIELKSSGIDQVDSNITMDETKNADRQTNVKPLFGCTVCNAFSMVENDLKNHHMMQHKDIPIDQNMFKLIREDYVIEHQIFHCTECSCVINKKNMKKHQLKRHKNIPLKQNIFKVMSIQRVVSKVVSSETTEEPVTMHEVPKTEADCITTENSDLNSVQLSIVPENESNLKPVKYKVIESHRLKCDDCDEHVSKYSLKEHHSQKHNTMPFTMDSFKKLESTILCLACDKSMLSTHFDVHKNVLHNPYFPIKWVDIKKYICTICNNESVLDLTRHYKKRHKNIPIDDQIFDNFKIETLIQCVFCESQMKEGRLENHMYTFHSKEMLKVKSYPSIAINSPNVNTEPEYKTIYLKACQCDICGGRYIEKRYSKFYNPINDGFTPRYLCGICRIQSSNGHFDAPNYLSKRYHRKQISEDQEISNDDQESEIMNTKMYLCQICGKNGIVEDKLEEHHSEIHINIPMTFDIFKFVAARLDGECTICEKNVKGRKFKEHIELFHPSTQVKGNKKGKIFQYNFLRNSTAAGAVGFDSMKNASKSLDPMKQSDIPVENKSSENAFGVDMVRLVEF